MGSPFRVLALTLLLGCGPLLTGCSVYAAAPPPGADFKAVGLTPAQRDAMTDDSISTALAKKPLAVFPTAVAVARIEGSGYRTDTAEGYGTGKYSVVFVRDVEKPAQFQRLSRLPMINGLAPLNPMLLPRDLQSERDLRVAAAQLHADLLLVYTLDTKFVDTDMAGILTVVTLGASPNQHISVVTTASAVIVDTRNGYLYGTAEATEKRDGLSNAWFSEAAVDGSRRDTETAAFEKLVGELEGTWTAVVKQYAGAATTRPAAQ